jgi:hypothetical protein
MREPYYYCVRRQGVVDVPMSQLPLETLRDIASGAPVIYRGQQPIEDGLGFVRFYAGVLLRERGL